MVNLSEQNIKKATLAMLKQYYRYRPREGQSTLRLDMRASDDIIVDGYLAFPEDVANQKQFIATFEATSYSTRDEVRYQVLWRLMFWDATAAAFFIAALWFGYLHARDLISVYELGWGITLLGILGSILLGQLAYRFFFRSLRRYRYIYAIEQFKRYYADEQWVAVGEDVFSGTNDKYLEELREQCIDNGFGLIIVDRDLQPTVHITPSRVDLFENQRQKVDFLSLEEFTRRHLPNVKQTAFWKRWMGWIPTGAGDSQEELLRFRRTYFHQGIVCLFSAMLIGGILFREWQERPLEYVDESDYRDSLIQQKERNEYEREPLGYLLDTPMVPPFRREVDPYIDVDQDLPSQMVPVRRRPGLILYEGDGEFFEYDCERLLTGVTAQYVIAVEVFDNLNSIRSLIRSFREKGLNAMGLWQGCFTTEEDDFVLFLEQLYGSRQEAERELAQWQKRLERNGFSTKLEVLELQRRQSLDSSQTSNQ